MLLRDGERSPARMSAAGSLFLALGLALMALVHPSARLSRDLIDGLSGLCMGLAIALNFFAARAAKRRTRPCAPPSSPNSSACLLPTSSRKNEPI